MGKGVLSWYAGFSQNAGSLYCDAVPLDAVAAATDTPVYVYSASAINTQFVKLTDALGQTTHRIHYSVKANGNLAILRCLRELGAGVDIVSGGELYRARHAGFQGSDIVFSGVGKTKQELHEAIATGVLLINIESSHELDLIDEIASGLARQVPIGIRVNPEVTVDTSHPYIKTGVRAAKFGIPYDEVVNVAKRASAMPTLRLAGIGMHIGSMVADTEPYERGIERLLDLVGELRGAGIADDLRYLDLGGGLAVSYGAEPTADVEAFGRVAAEAARRSRLSIIIEPGRFVMANSGVLLTRVLDRKRSGNKTFIITDAGMTELLRPSHYQAYHRIEAVHPRATRSLVDVCGPVCESGDFLGLDRELDDVEPGDLVVVHSAGAYGFVMSSNYNARPRVSEVLVDGDRYAVVRERETYADLVRHEVSPPEWRSA